MYIQTGGVEMPAIKKKGQNNIFYYIRISCSLLPFSLGGIFPPAVVLLCNSRTENLTWIWVCYVLASVNLRDHWRGSCILSLAQRGCRTRQEFRVTQVWQTKCVWNWSMCVVLSFWPWNVFLLPHSTRIFLRLDWLVVGVEVNHLLKRIKVREVEVRG